VQLPDRIHVGIIGAGVAGLSCAQRLSEYGIAVTLFDKGKRPGGRLSSLILDDHEWDFGAQYFMARDPAFLRQIAQWQTNGIIAPWPDGPDDALVGTPSMAALIAAQCTEHDVRFNMLVQRIDQDQAGWHVTGADFSEGPFAALVVATPAEQAATLLGLHDLMLAREAAAIRSAPCWTLMVAFEEPLNGVADVIQNSGPISWASRNASKPGRVASNCWVIHANADWSKANLECTSDDVADRLLGAFADEMGVSLPPTTFCKAHRWRFAWPYGQRGTPLWNDDIRLGACGDWCGAPLIEGAWLSGQDLANNIGAALQSMPGKVLAC
jgi:renalase